MFPIHADPSPRKTFFSARAPPRFQVPDRSAAKLFRRFEVAPGVEYLGQGGDIGGRIGVPDGIACLDPRGLRKHSPAWLRADEPVLLESGPGGRGSLCSRQALRSPPPTPNGNRFSHHDRQVPLHGWLDLGPGAGSEVLPPWPRPCAPPPWWSAPGWPAVAAAGVHDQTGQPGRPRIACGARRGESVFFHSQLYIGGEWSTVAGRAQVVRTGDGNLAHSGPHRLGAQLLITGSVAATARNAPLVGRRDGERQPLPERRRSGVGQSRAHGSLDGFQMEMAAVTALREDDAQQLVYCACDFLADRCRRFFPLVSDRRSLTNGNVSGGRNAFFATSKSLSLAKHLLSTSCDTVSGEKGSSTAVPGKSCVHLDEGSDSTPDSGPPQPPRAGPSAPPPWQTLGDGLAVQLIGYPQVTSMAGFARLVAVAVGVSAAPSSRGNRTRAEVG